MTTPRTLQTLLILMLSASLLMGAACSAEETVTAKTTAATAPSLTIELQQGQLLSVVSIATKAGAAAQSVRDAYGREAFGLAREYGLNAEGSLPVAAVGVGGFAPEAVSFFTWPDAESEAAFSSLPRWQPIKATRPDGWDELRIHDVVVDTDLTLTFRADKTYTMATAWLDPAHPGDYDRYLASIEPTLTAIGGRFMYQLRDPRFASLDSEHGAPGRITFVEWDSSDGLAEFQQADGFLSHYHLLQSGTSGFELVVLDTSGIGSLDGD